MITSELFVGLKATGKGVRATTAAPHTYVSLSRFYNDVARMRKKLSINLVYYIRKLILWYINVQIYEVTQLFRYKDSRLAPSIGRLVWSDLELVYVCIY